MKALKVTLLLAVLFASLTSCVRQDLDEGDLLEANGKKTHMPPTGGQGHDG